MEEIHPGLTDKFTPIEDKMTLMIQSLSELSNQSVLDLESDIQIYTLLTNIEMFIRKIAIIPNFQLHH